MAKYFSKEKLIEWSKQTEGIIEEVNYALSLYNNWIDRADGKEVINGLVNLGETSILSSEEWEVERN